MSDSRGLRRAEFAVAAFGLTAFLLALLFVIDGVRFHSDLLLHALSDIPRGQFHHGHELLLMALVLFDVVALARSGRSLWRGASAHRRLAAALPVSEERAVGGRTVLVVPGAAPRAFCAGLARPRVYVSEGAIGRLNAAELAAVVAHEGHHADRRDPLRILVARAIGDAYSLPALPRREQALSELAADAAAVRRGGTAPLASALLAFPGGIAPERVDRLAGARPVGQVPTAMVVCAALVIAALSLGIAAQLLVSGHPPFCVPLAAPGWILVAVIARFVALGPAWLGWRRAERFLRPAPST
ncbi:M56 family metallopeptidase [Solirubrobacter sp. CPCC 204708]|uniref:M56 family metallopeptidase n=1 Tax=Solirubrobacter deserti TaxID=2282478 RepID=A0ABT4RTA0_9ACTN|nr:M56 family metallopeptidase [Solirubrobacter deserti]MBE2316181.1 M56 family metallopeptidase [Solirubrobacter deserti]MDA0141807.1 M56 family metallopeptidase [Solirubrobacter deserti]